MKETVKAVGAIIKKDNKYFICKRADGDKEAIYKWEFPGGTVEPGETNEQALLRELQEEFLVNIKITNYFCRSTKEYEERIIDLYCYEATCDEEFKIQEDHLDCKWVTKEELKNYDYPPVDQEIIERILRDENEQ